VGGDKPQTNKLHFWEGALSPSLKLCFIFGEEDEAINFPAM
jgi:hypothetical protein